MTEYFFNELSFDADINCPEKLRLGLKELRDFFQTVLDFRKTPYLHQLALYQRQIMGIPFRKSVQKNCSQDEVRRIMRLIDISFPALPGDAVKPEHLRVFCGAQELGDSALAECAYRRFMDEPAASYSLSLSSFFARTPLPMGIYEGDQYFPIEIENFFAINAVQKHCEAALPGISDWDDMLERAVLIPKIIINEGIRDHLSRHESFDSTVAKTVLTRLYALSEMSMAETHEAFLEAEKKYCHGKERFVHFSDSSDTEKNKFRQKMTFMVNNTPRECFFHSKIAHQSFRIHMVERPERGKDNIIVYIGYKLTI